jgi:Gamma tubulin complex component C-terminal
VGRAPDCTLALTLPSSSLFQFHLSSLPLLPYSLPPSLPLSRAILLAVHGARAGQFERWRLRVFALHPRTLAFVQQILAFASFEVLEPNWCLLEAKLTCATTVGQLLRDHVNFLDRCLVRPRVVVALG